MISIDPILGAIVAAITILAAILTILGYMPNIISFLHTPAHYLNPRKLLRNIYWVRRFWAPIVTDSGFIIVFPDREKKPSIPGIISYDVKSINILLRELTSKFASVDYQSITDVEFGSEHKNHHLIAVAGPVSNKLTWVVLQNNELPYAFEQNGDELSATIIPKAENEDPYEPETTQDDTGAVPEVSTDYGIITRIESPYDPDRFILNVSGGFGPGTFSGFELLTDPDTLARICCEGGREFQVLYTVSVDRQGVIQTPEIINIKSIDISS
ncbi:hypothetical protein [Haloferax volcanii]|uniref:hypothetical protein n=1 Tax=Haloferax volcanii TaxID=2246 RepID=UPI0038585514